MMKQLPVLTALLCALLGSCQADSDYNGPAGLGISFSCNTTEDLNRSLQLTFEIRRKNGSSFPLANRTYRNHYLDKVNAYYGTESGPISYKNINFSSHQDRVILKIEEGQTHPACKIDFDTRSYIAKQTCDFEDSSLSHRAMNFKTRCLRQPKMRILK